MISAGTLHVVATELAIGMISLAGISIVLRLLLTFKEDDISVLSQTLDSTSLVAAIGGLTAIPFAVITGISASPGEGIDDPLLFNKVLLSWISVGLWAAWIHGRITMGPMLWRKRNLAVLQGLLGMAACGCVLTVASLGGKYSRGESLMGPLSKPLEYSIAIGDGSALIALLASAAALISVLWMMPKPEKID